MNLVQVWPGSLACDSSEWADPRHTLQQQGHIPKYWHNQWEKAPPLAPANINRPLGRAKAPLPKEICPCIPSTACLPPTPPMPAAFPNPTLNGGGVSHAVPHQPSSWSLISQRGECRYEQRGRRPIVHCLMVYRTGTDWWCTAQALTGRLPGGLRRPISVL